MFHPINSKLGNVSKVRTRSLGSLDDALMNSKLATFSHLHRNLHYVPMMLPQLQVCSLAHKQETFAWLHNKQSFRFARAKNRCSLPAAKVTTNYQRQSSAVWKMQFPLDGWCMLAVVCRRRQMETSSRSQSNFSRCTESSIIFFIDFARSSEDKCTSMALNRFLELVCRWENFPLWVKFMWLRIRRINSASETLSKC